MRSGIVVILCACVLCAAVPTALGQGRGSKSKVFAKKHKERYRAWKIKNEVARDDSAGRTTTAEYDSLGNKIHEIVLVDDSTVEQESSFRFDSTGEVLLEASVTRPTDRRYPGTSKVTYTYNGSNDPTEVVQHAPDGTPVSKSEFEYDATGRMEKMRTKRGDNALLLNIDMRYDADGNVVEAVGTDSTGVTTSRTVYAYDDSGNALEQSSYTGGGARINRLVFTYDAAGNMLTIRNHNALDSLVAVTTNVYDSAGNVLVTTNSAPSASYYARTTMSYDAEGKLIEVVTTDRGGTVTRRVRYTFEKRP